MASEAAGPRRRVDQELVRRGLVRSRDEARDVIVANRVQVDGAPVRKPSSLVRIDQRLIVGGPPPRFVSRGGDKLQHALDVFDLDVVDATALDAGISTGGFTDALLQAGAREVIGIDVGYGQLAERLRRDARVRLLERTNVRQVDLEIIGGRPVDILVADLSFISLTKVLPVLLPLVADTGTGILLVKPQFEAERADIGKGGVVRRPDVWESALGRVGEAVEDAGWTLCGLTVSPIRGAAGNVEFLALIRREPSARPSGPVRAQLIAEVLPPALALSGLSPDAGSDPAEDGSDEQSCAETPDAEGGR